MLKFIGLLSVFSVVILWTASPNNGGKFRMPHSPEDAAYLSGLNHNVFAVIPSEKLVIVRMGEDAPPLW